MSSKRKFRTSDTTKIKPKAGRKYGVIFVDGVGSIIDLGGAGAVKGSGTVTQSADPLKADFERVGKDFWGAAMKPPNGRRLQHG